jgi:uncharacterized secreted protein with C-terminal beta-propeller domain
MKKVYACFFPLLLLLFSLNIAGCFRPVKGTIRPEAYVPIYGFDSSLRKISAASPQPTEHAGKIYVLGKTLYQVELDKGIHVIDYTDEKNPQKLGFIKVGGCSEVAVKNNVLLTNCLNDVVSIDISDLSAPKELNRVVNAFSNQYYYNEMAARQKPPYPNVYFQCPNGYNGDVIGWKLEKNVEWADCKTN